jgi:hypothetical protein
MQFSLVLQTNGSSLADFDACIEVEDQLEGVFGDYAVVDGHDFGSGEMNIFIDTDEPEIAFDAAKAVLATVPAWAEYRAAYRESDGETYTVLWPAGIDAFEVI